MKKTILSLFILATLGITSCSSDSNSEASTNPNDLLVVAFKATGEGTNIENFARDKEGTKVLSLDGQSNNASFTEVTITKNGTNSNSSFTISGRNVTTKDNTPVGEYSISYRITNGSTTSSPTTQSFTVYYNETKTFDGVQATIYQFLTNLLDGTINPSNSQSPELVDGVSSFTSQTRTLNGVPYQFLIGSRLYQLSLEIPTNSAYDFPSTSGTSEWKICKLSLSTSITDFLLPTEVINKSVRTKTYNQIINNQITRSITFYELRVDNDWDTSTNYQEVPESTPNPNNSNNVVVFGRDQI